MATNLVAEADWFAASNRKRSSLSVRCAGAANEAKDIEHEAARKFYLTITDGFRESYHSPGVMLVVG